MSGRWVQVVPELSGRELDAEVAERVMGWQWMSRVNYSGATGPDDLKKTSAWLFPPDSEDTDTGKEGMFGETIYMRNGIVGPFVPCLPRQKETTGFHGPRYSSDIAAAMQVEGRIAEMELQSRYAAALWIVAGDDAEKANQHYGNWDLIHATAEQRCRAALAAVNGKEPQ